MKTNNIFLVAIGLLLLSYTANASDYVLDKNTSGVKWLAKKVTGQHHGTIALSQGTLQVKDGNPSGGEFLMDMNSIVCEDLNDATWNQKLIGHLKSDDFFSVEKFSVAKLVLTNVKEKSGNTFTFSGDLTIKGTTNPIVFDAEVLISNNTAKAKGQMVIDRTLYNIRYGSGKFFENLGNKMIEDTFTLDFDLTAIK